MASSSYTPVVVGTGLAFIAWGLITALFIPTGWLPNARFAALVVPMITFLIPVLIGYTGGRAVHGQRGAVVGAVATVGIIVGSNVPMILGAMIVGPLTAYLLKRFDAFTEDRIRPGFEMLVENFSAGILGGGMAVLGVWVIGPVVRAGTTGTGHGVEWLVNHHLLPFASFLIEPGKVLFLNNAINHGVLGPLGVAQAAEHGKSVLFMLESNPGPGLGVLLAYLLFGPRLLRPTVPAAIIIQFFGGIHEIYFPYVLMKPRMILAAIAGGASGILVFLATGAGLVATPSPGSIFAYAAETPPGSYFGVFAGVLVAAAVSFTVGSALLGFGKLAEPKVETSAAAPERAGEAEAADTAAAEPDAGLAAPKRKGQPSQRAGAQSAAGTTTEGSPTRTEV